MTLVKIVSILTTTTLDDAIRAFLENPISIVSEHRADLFWGCQKPLIVRQVLKLLCYTEHQENTYFLRNEIQNLRFQKLQDEICDINQSYQYCEWSLC